VNGLDATFHASWDSWNARCVRYVIKPDDIATIRNGSATLVRAEYRLTFFAA
jgi:hypothetical protein